MPRNLRPVAALGLIAIATMGAPVSSHEYGTGTVTVAHPWARATATGNTTTELFMEIKAAAPKKGVRPARDRLVAVRTVLAEQAEIHTYALEKGVWKMRRVDGIAIPPGHSVILGPRRHHIMIIGLKAPLKEGDLLPVTLTFENAGELTIEATVEPVDAEGPHGFDHQPGHEAKGGGSHKH